MSRKSRGIGFERELVHLLQDNNFAAIRVAGSGCTVTPSADILSGNGQKVFCFECKSSSSDVIYISKQSIEDFLEFSYRFGAQPFIAVRFLREQWRFLHPQDIPQTTVNVVINKKFAFDRGFILDDLVRVV
jgi:holliday junction resolvase Hjr